MADGCNLFKPYGESWVVENPETPVTNEITRKFTGQEFDQETGLYYMNARYYDPKIGMFLAPDPAMSGLNHYAYCSANPIRYTDPTGLAAEGTEGGDDPCPGTEDDGLANSPFTDSYYDPDNYSSFDDYASEIVVINAMGDENSLKECRDMYGAYAVDEIIAAYAHSNSRGSACIPNEKDRAAILQAINVNCPGRFDTDKKGYLYLAELQCPGKELMSSVYQTQLCVLNDSSHKTTITKADSFLNPDTESIEKVDDHGGGVTIINHDNKGNLMENFTINIIISGNKCDEIFTEHGNGESQPLAYNVSDILMHEVVSHAVTAVNNFYGNAIIVENNTRSPLGLDPRECQDWHKTIY